MTHEITSLNIARFFFWGLCALVCTYLISLVTAVAVEAAVIIGSQHMPEVCQNLYGKN